MEVINIKIVIGSMQCEGNSLTPIYTKYEDFDYAKGEDMYSKIAVYDYFKNFGCDVVPTIYAHALPGGAIYKEDFLRLTDELVSAIPNEDVDGVWLFIHGAMYVEEIGSGDTYLLREVRKRVGNSVPISVAMDFHADNTDEIIDLVNCVTGFRTAPHTDHADTQLRAAKMLIDCIENKILPKPQIERANVIICGDAVQTSLEPLKGIMELADQFEKNIDGMMSVQVFNGQPWIDEEYIGPSFVVTHKNDTKLAKETAKKLADKFYEVRHDFKFLIETGEVDDVINTAMSSKEQVFISDSGDNTTAGAAGDNAFMLNKLIKHKVKNCLLAGIADEKACEICYNADLGDTLSVTVGGSLDKNSESATITGKLIHKGDILSYTGANAGPSVTIDCGDITVVITKNRASLCRPDIFESINLDYKKFHIVVVKLGYLFPELSKEAPRSILAFTPGSSTERLEDMNLKNIRRPMYPLDDNFLNI